MRAVQRDQKRISGPLMDRIDIHLEVKRVPFQKLTALDGGELSSVIRRRVETARETQARRFAAVGKPNLLVNGDMGPAEGQRFCAIDLVSPNGVPVTLEVSNDDEHQTLIELLDRAEKIGVYFTLS